MLFISCCSILVWSALKALFIPPCPLLPPTTTFTQTFKSSHAGMDDRKFLRSKTLPITLPCLPQFEKPDDVIAFWNVGTCILEV